MAPHSPFPGLPISVESRAPLLPLTRPYAQLLSGSRPPSQTTNEPLSSLRADPKLPPVTTDTSANANANSKAGRLFTPHLPGRPHRAARYSGLSSLIFTVLLVMLIGGSGAVCRYQALNGGRRQQSVVDVVRSAYFERDVVPPMEVSEFTPVIRQRDPDGGPESPSSDSPAVALPAPSASASSASTSTSPTSSSTSPMSSAGSKSTFRDGEDVRDPSAAKGDDGEDSGSGGGGGGGSPSTSASSSNGDVATQPTAPPSPAKRHWSSRARRAPKSRRQRRRSLKRARCF